ncbi:MAG: hypothetical protein HY901_12385, partial [Deltaproteobacteria bacterium]|nr:hypothetical protein [Deltaproteobacteria bacterium]
MRSLITCLAVCWSASALGQVPKTIAYQGVLTQSDGQPVTGSKQFGYAIYPAPTGGTAFWQETQQVALNANGEYALYLGSVEPFPDSLFDGADLWLEVIVNGGALVPRQRVTSVPYAIRAGSARVSAGTGLSGDGLPNAPLKVDFGVYGKCSGTQKVTGIDTDSGGVQCAADQTGTEDYSVFGRCNASSKVIGIDPDTGAVQCATDQTGTMDFTVFGKCNGTSKVTGIDPNSGAVTCGVDISSSGTIDYAVFGQCSNGQKVKGIDPASGAVQCAADQGITGVTAGTGLAGGGTVGNVTLSADYTRFGSCAFSDKVSGVDPTTGAVQCEVDLFGTGTVTSIAAGAGLSGGTITSSGTLAIANGGVTEAMLSSCGCISGEILQWNGTAWICASPGGGGTVTSVAAGAGLSGGTITGSGTLAVAAGGITSTLLADGAVTTAKIAPGAVGTANLADGAITAAKLNSCGCAAGQLLQWNGSLWVCVDPGGSGTVTSVTAGAGLSGGTITGSGTLAVAAGGITSTLLADDAVTTAKLANASVTNAKIAANAVGTTELIDGSVTAAEIDANAVGTTELMDGSVTAAKLNASGCASGQILQYTGSAWVCVAGPAGSTTWTVSGNDVYRATGNVGIGTSSPTGTLNVVATSTSNDCQPGVSNTASASSFTAPYSADLAFDGDSTSASKRWMSGSLVSGSWWLSYDFDAGDAGAQKERIIGSYTIYFTDANPSVNFSLSPRDWKLQASTDGATWTDLDTQTNQGWTADGPKTYAIASPGLYRFYRLNITKNKAQSSDWVIVNELTLSRGIEDMLVVRSGQVNVGSVTPAWGVPPKLFVAGKVAASGYCDASGNNCAAAGALNGDVTGNPSANTVGKLQGRPVAATAPSSND